LTIARPRLVQEEKSEDPRRQWNSVVFFPDRVSKLRAPCTKCTVLYSERITESKADSSAYGLSTVM